MKNIGILLLTLFSLQSYSQDIITTSGGEGVGVVWTIGGILTNTLSDNNTTTMVSQGFIQPEYAVPGPTGILDVSSSKIAIKVYPNPVLDLLSLNIQDGTPYAWTLCNVLGQKLASGTSDDSESTINFSKYPSGQYVLKVTYSEGSQSMKIIK